MPKFLTIHDETGVDRILLESRWSEIARDSRAEWQMTLFTEDLGRRFCEWDAPDRRAIEEIFQEMGIKWSEIIRVELTSSSLWRLWEMETGKRMKNCWEVANCEREPMDSTSADDTFCPAAVDARHAESNRARIAGTYCWKVVETFCEEKVPGTLAEKRISSEECPFFAKAQSEQGHRLEP